MEFRIPKPCPEPWEEMEARPQGRHCARCDRTLIDFTSMTRRRAEAVARTLEGPVCGRMAYDKKTGEPWFQPEPARAPHWASGVVLVAALTAAGCGTRARASEGEAQSELIETVEGPQANPEGTESSPSPEAALEPLDERADPGEPEIVTRAVPAAELDLPDDPAAPTAEQRRLTRHKQRASAPPPVPTHVAVYDGFMF